MSSASSNKDPITTLKELFIEIRSHRGQIAKVCALSLLIGLILGFSIPKEFTCLVKLAPEEKKAGLPGSVSGLAAIAGIDLDAGNQDGINLALYPDIVQSMPFLYELISMKVQGDLNEPPVTLYQYLDEKIKYPWWKSAFIIPFKLLDRLIYGENNAKENAIDPYRLTRSQDRIFSQLKKRITVSIDKKTGVLTSWITLQDPVIAAVVADSLASKLEDYIINYHTNKAQQDLNFVLQVFTEAKANYYRAQQNYARYLDKNKNVILESVLIEKERLKNELSLTYNVYSSLAQQVENAKMKVQEQTPCFTVLEPARVPVKKSNVSKTTLLILFGLLGFFISIFRLIYLNRNKLNLFSKTLS